MPPIPANKPTAVCVPALACHQRRADARVGELGQSIGGGSLHFGGLLGFEQTLEDWASGLKIALAEETNSGETLGLRTVRVSGCAQRAVQ